MNILVLGNGFDLALGLPTRYTDFLEFADIIKNLCPHERLTEKCINNAPMGAFSGMNDRNHDAFVNRLGEAFQAFQNPSVALKDIYECIHENAWINYFKDRLEKNQISGENWIDLEKEIKNVIQILADVSYNIDYLGDFNDQSFTTMSRRPVNIACILNELEHNKNKVALSKGTYLRFKQDLRSDFQRFVYALEIYFDFFVGLSKIEENGKLPNVLKNLHFDKVLSFNYTPYWKLLNNGEIDEQDICFVHGKLSYHRWKNNTHTVDDMIKNSNVIIGVDEYLDENKKNEQLEFVYYKKYFQRIAKGTGSSYMEWLDEWQQKVNFMGENVQEQKVFLQEHPQNHVYILGHSMDPTDKEIFKDILAREPNDTKVTIYYHDEEAHERIIMNLIAIIGQDRLIEKTHRRGGREADIKIVCQSEY